MELEDVLEEYWYYCKARGFTEKTMINKYHELKQFKRFLKEKRAVSELESITVYDMRAYIRHKQDSGLKSQSIVSMAKMIKAFLNWTVKNEYLEKSPMDKVELPKPQKKVLKGFTTEEVYNMINSFSSKNYLEARNKAICAM
ncbi:MAG TPA: phage integrase SAM-like domain-containing protein, partial [Sporolactobacillaceae bacterium]|nr:phage integrase SAM-like domain-containing protein [Sporolactobacillaceae bacterium]